MTNNIRTFLGNLFQSIRLYVSFVADFFIALGSNDDLDQTFFRYEKKHSERGAAYVRRIIREVADGRRYELDPFHLHGSCPFFEAPLTFGEIKFDGSISGLKTLQTGPCSLIVMKDFMHINADLEAGPLDCHSLVTVSFLGFKLRFFLNATLSKVNFVCDVTVDSEKDTRGLLNCLFVEDIKGVKLWIPEGLGVLKWPINLAMQLAIFLKPLVRDRVQYLFEYYLKDAISEYEFPIIEGLGETSSSGELSEEPRCGTKPDSQVLNLKESPQVTYIEKHGCYSILSLEKRKSSQVQ